MMEKRNKVVLGVDRIQTANRKYTMENALNKSVIKSHKKEKPNQEEC